jgi:hypothetical protein
MCSLNLDGVRAKEALATPDPRKPWIGAALAAGRRVPNWIGARATSREQFEQLMALRERAFPATRRRS